MSISLPCSMTRIWSQSVNDARRCETMTIVRPDAMRVRLALTTASLRVEGARPLVEDQDSRVVDQGAGDRDPLLLPARQIRRALLDVGLVAVRHALDEFFGAGEPGGLDRIRQGQSRPPRNDVVADRAAEQEIVLQHDPEALPQMPQIDLAQIRPVDLQEPAVVAVDPLQEARDR